MSGIPAWVFVGAQVVCVGEIDVPDDLIWRLSLPEVGKTYTVRSASFGERDEEPCIRLAEVTNPSIRYEDDANWCIWNGEPRFALSNFRPAVDRKTEAEDLALFRHHIDQRQRVDA